MRPADHQLLSRHLRRVRAGAEPSSPNTIPAHRRDIRYSIAASRRSTFAPLPPRQQSADLHLDVVADLAKGTTGITHPEIVDPPGERGIDLLHQVWQGGCTPAR